MQMTIISLKSGTGTVKRSLIKPVGKDSAVQLTGRQCFIPFPSFGTKAASL